MRKALSIVLAGLLIILPVEQVLAQAVRREGAGRQRTPPPDGATHLFRVPPLTENAIRLLRTRSTDALLESFSNPAPVAGWSDWSNKKRTVVFVAGLAAVILLFKILCPDGCGLGGQQEDGP